MEALVLKELKGLKLGSSKVIVVPKQKSRVLERPEEKIENLLSENKVVSSAQKYRKKC